jgi:hypothetical protein
MWEKCPMCRYRCGGGCARFEEDAVYLNRHWLWHMKDTHGIFEDDVKDLIINALRRIE